MSSQNDAHEALMAKIAEMAPHQNGPVGILRLAEAYAYLVSPNQPHGSITTN